MKEEGRFTIHMEQRDGYEFTVRFDQPKLDEMLMDEPPPLGSLEGPNASRLLAAAAANCLSASLLFCLAKDNPPDQSIKTEATCKIVRNEKGRLRVGELDVNLTINSELEHSRRTSRCMNLFEDFCVISSSIRQGIPVHVRIQNEAGDILHEAD
ncbi:MAG: hypothetical protein BMS9Abin15_0033 [Gammaproteobacteria bacterium]|nr:MAG: hypothetical protein BMS9Abin15_0033 [Gammaproteobacteria bacterium]